MRWRILAVFLAAFLIACSGDTEPTVPDGPDMCVTGFECSREPEEVAGGLLFSTVTSGGEHSCALTDAGEAFCWGSNRNGQLGGGTSITFSAAPVAVAGGRSYVAISAGAFHTCALTEQGSAYCWGNGANGALGSGLLFETCGSIECSREPVQVIGGHTFIALDAGFNHSCGVTSFHIAYCWGANTHGELGNGGYFSGSSLPEPVTGDHQFNSITTGLGYSCAITLAGVAWCWGGGDGESYVLGTVVQAQCPGGSSASRCSPIPLEVQTSTTFLRLVAGDRHVCGLSFTLQVLCWGENSHGQRGTGGSSATHIPVQVSIPGNPGISEISAAESHTCVITNSALAYCWGNNRSGQLGIGREDENAQTPVQVSGGYEFGAISGGGNSITGHTCALGADRKAYCWGSRELGQVGGG